MMNNKLIIAAAGSGKTTYLVRKALEVNDEKVLITTFTEANSDEIINKLIKKNGFVPPHITVQTWFSFLLQHGVKPYQGVLTEKRVNGVFLVNTKSAIKYYNKGKPVCYTEDEIDKHYFDSQYRIYTDKISKFAFRCNEITGGDVIKRICGIYQHIFIDEIQDMAGYDLDFIKCLMHDADNVVMVGDPRQVTYHTHDELKNKTYTNGGIDRYIIEKCGKLSCEIDKVTLKNSFRNNREICLFANNIYPNHEECQSKNETNTGHDGVFLVRSNDVEEYLKIYNPIQLRDSISVTVHSEYPVLNFGASKGLTYERVLIYPTKPMRDWILDHSLELKDQSRSRFYVAVTRAKYSTAIIFNYKDNVTYNGCKKFR